MILIKPSFEIEGKVNGMEILKSIEKAGRTCYKSESKITEDSAKKFVGMVIERGHTSVIEHEKITARIICDRGVTHEIVRHRLASYSQESTRYCNYKGGVTFIIPCWFDDSEYGGLVGRYTGEITNGHLCKTDGEIYLNNDAEMIWMRQMIDSEEKYLMLLQEGWTPQQARSVLPNSLKTEIVMTMNIREWRWFFKKRASKYAHPQMQEIAYPMLEEFKKLVPVVFEDLSND
jgi:thymidylate synthase (FAD)